MIEIKSPPGLEKVFERREVRKNDLLIPEQPEDRLLWVKEAYDRFHSQIKQFDELKRYYS